jgi:hypothetical protein
MEEELLLISLSNTTVKYMMYNGGGAYNPVGIQTPIELIRIYPHYPFLKIIMNYLFTPLKPVLHNLDENVCFLDIAENKKTISFIVGCDWCSICNGIVETAKSNIVKNHKITKSIDFEKLKIMDKYLDFILVDRTEKLTNEKIKEWCENIFGKISIDLLLFSQIYLKFEMIELRWCPFKRSKEFYYRNKDKRYLEPTEKTIYEVGKILSKHETITCNNCPKVVNKNWKYTKSNKHSIFQPLLDYMIHEIKKS